MIVNVLINRMHISHNVNYREMTVITKHDAVKQVA
jgi:hypothetical protein